MAKLLGKGMPHQLGNSENTPYATHIQPGFMGVFSQ